MSHVGGLRAVWALAPCTASCGQGAVGDRGLKSHTKALAVNVAGRRYITLY